MSLKKNAAVTSTVSIVKQIADREGVSVTDLPPLYGTVDPDLLEEFAASPLEDVDLTFDYYGYTVTVSATGEVAVEPIKDPLPRRIRDDV